VLLGIRWGSLRIKIIAWSFVPTAIILLAVALVTFFAFQQVTETLVLERDVAVTQVSASRLATDLEEYADILTTLARTSDIYQDDPSTQRDALKRASNRLVIFDGGALLLDAFGKVVGAEPERPEILEQDWSNRSYYQEVVRLQIADSSTEVVISDIVADGPGGADVIVIAVPIIGEQGEFHGMLAGLFRLGRTTVSAFYGDIVRLRIVEEESGIVYMVDGKGRIIYHSDTDLIGQDFSTRTVVPRVLSGEADAIHTRDSGGQDIVASFASVPGTSWGLIAGESWATLTHDSRDYQRFLLLLLVLGVVVPAIVVTFGVGMIARPITDLISAAQEVAKGNFDHTITAQTGDEVEELAQQFNLMAAQLQASYAHLEQEVNARTKELATLNVIASVVNRSLDLDEILNAALDETLAMLDASAGIIALLESDLDLGKDVLTLRVQRGFTAEFVEVVRHVCMDEGISGRAVAQGQPIVLDVPEYAQAKYAKRYVSAVLQEGMQTLASIPIVYRQQALGALTIGTKQPRAFPPQELELLAAIGGEIGVGVGNALLYASVQQELTERKRVEEELRRVSDERERRNRELVLLNRVIAATTSRLEPKAVLEAVCRELALAFDLPEAGAALLDEGGATLTVVAEYKSEERPSALGAVIPVERNPATQYVLEHKAPLAVADAQRDPRMAPIHDLMRQRDVISLLILPLVVRDEVVGTIGLVTVERREFTDDEIALAASATATAAQALETARAEEALRRSEQKLSLHVQHTPLAYIEWDADLQVVDWNPAAERIFGYGKGEAMNCHAYEIIVPPEVQPHVTQVWQSILNQTGGTRSTNENVTKDGRAIVCEWYNTPLIDDDGKVFGLASLVQDITERVQAEEKLREAKAAAEAANRAKSVFLANMSHELRTPLNAILGFSQLMTRDRWLTPEQKENLEIISRSGEHLLTLINDVLEMSKIEAGRTTLYERSFDLHRLLDSIRDMFHLQATDVGLHLVFDRAPNVPQYVRTDEGKLRQVLINMLSNAIKFTQEGGVTVRVVRQAGQLADQQVVDGGGSREPADLQACRLEFKVQDTGAGIAPDDVKSLFDPFVQTASGLDSQEGTGLGLPISRQYVRLMGGDITVHTELGRGTTFRFDIQVELVGASDVQVEPPMQRVIGLEPGQPVYRLLIVEDRETNRKLLSKLLKPMGFEVREAINGQEALEIWEHWDPHLIWMDMRMPVMDGHEATKRIKATTKGQATVIIALTASAFEEDRKTILSAGCDDFIRKPFREAEIYDKLAKHLGVRFVCEGVVEGEEEVVAEDVLTPAALAVLPADWLAELYQAAAQADVDLAFDLIERIREQDGSLADALAGLVAKFRFDIIVTLAQDVGG
jgi:PAS domain S-box-containing protein